MVFSRQALQGAEQCSRLSGGLRFAPTTGYYLTALRAEICFAFSQVSTTHATARCTKGKCSNRITTHTPMLQAEFSANAEKLAPT
jgi:hypothetical protein